MESKTKKKLGAAGASVAAVGAAIALTAGTFSYFSDSQTGQAQQVSAGTLKLHLGGTAESNPISLTNAKPGDSSKSRTINFVNKGSVSGEVRIGITGYGGKNCLNDVHLNIPSGANTLNGDNSVSDDITNSKGGVRIADLGKGDTKSFAFTVNIPGNVDNELQGKTCGFKIVADLVQIDSSGVVGSPGFPANKA
jgi:predicted ribosomally synthesized peptide with SipW-like signal peptide